MADYIFEVSSEAGRKIGGIYTVLKSKTKYVVDRFGDNYLLIGLLDEKCESDFKEETPPEDIAKVFGELEPLGIKCRYGRWVYGSNARIILVDGKQFGEMEAEYVEEVSKRDKRVNYIRFQLWKNFGVDSMLETAWDFNENIVWGFAVGTLIEKLASLEQFRGKDIVCHFHEWIAGSALLYCKMHNVPVSTVFTTHATVLGRTLASFGRDVLAEAMDPAKKINVSDAYRFKVEGKHLLEAAAAKNADVFTTVSATVADEVNYILGRKADVITLNGEEFEGADEAELVSSANYIRSELIQFAESYFAPHYKQDYRDPIFIYTAARYEYLNKGFDIFIESLAKLNRRLKKRGTERRIFAFIFSPSAARGPRVSVIKNYLLMDKIGEVLEQIPELKGVRYTNLQDMVEAVKKRELKQNILNMMRGFVREGGKPLINCFDLSYDNDIIIKSCYEFGLTNAEDDVVKMIFYPTYVKPSDGLLDMGYYDIIGGMDIGIFPSRYEPFGYTPVEAGSRHTISITSDTTGFGRFILSRVDVSARGLKVIKMAGEPKESVTDQLANELQQLYFMSREDIAKLKTDAYELVKLCNWKDLIENYFKAYDMAIERKRSPPQEREQKDA